MVILDKYYQKLIDIPGYCFFVDRFGKPDERNYIIAPYEEAHIIPGSFNPLHDTHREIYTRLTNEKPGVPKYFEISIERIGKDFLTKQELSERLSQFVNFAPVICSFGGRFIEKIGTYRSLAKKQYYHVGIDCIPRMEEDYGLIGIQGLNAEFFVYDRIVDGKHMSLTRNYGNRIPINCHIPDWERSTESLTRSSTQIRNSAQ